MTGLLLVPGVLSASELAELRDGLREARFTDGRVSAGVVAAEQKHVQQLDRSDNGQRAPGELIARALLRHPRVHGFAQPRSIRHPTLNRYEAGMFYGPHLDAPIMHGGVTTRADVSVTVFLTEPDSYGGGQLIIGEGAAAVSVKAAAGDAVLYSSGAIHQVAAVTSGVRLVAVTWIESLIRDPEQRGLLHTLGEGIFASERDGATPETLLRLRACHQNLLRMWAESPSSGR